MLLSHISPSSDAVPLMRLPNSATFQIPFLRLEALLSEHNITSTDRSGGLITLRRHCDISHDIDFLKHKVQEAFEDAYGMISIQNITLVPQSVLPADFKEYTLAQVRLSSVNIRSSQGTFSAAFTDKQGLRRTLYFRFHVEATLTGFKAKHNLPNGKILTLGDIEPVRFTLESLPSLPLQEVKPDTLVVKQYVREETLLLERQFDVRLLVQRRSSVEALMQDGGLVIGVRAQALEGGNEGDTIRIRTNEGKIFNARILSKHKVIIKE
ncbi:MAG: flagellar basal body P-ring formation protein FlgA [Campylobacterales bacterium]|nr:flagellar basal body P-ring formation protein FlgA [Campylobacterales bacterium]